MKRELKHVSDTIVSIVLWHIIAEPIPMKRELKRYRPEIFDRRRPDIAEPIPMKRELKQNKLSAKEKDTISELQSLSR